MERDGYSGTFDVPANSLLPHRFPDMTCHCNIWCVGDSAKSIGALSTLSGMKLCDSGKCLFIVRMMAAIASFVRARCDHLRFPFVSLIVTVIINTSL